MVHGGRKGAREDAAMRCVSHAATERLLNRNIQRAEEPFLLWSYFRLWFAPGAVIGRSIGQQWPAIIVVAGLAWLDWLPGAVSSKSCHGEKDRTISHES